MVIKNKKFSGGYRFKSFEGQPEERLVEAEAPEKVTIPLRQGFGNEVPPVVKVGDTVRAGQIIGINNDSVSSPVHSTVNGVVEGISKINYFKQEVNAVTIKSDNTPDRQFLDGYTADWLKLPVEKIEELIYLSGAASLGKEGIPTRFKSSSILPVDVKDVIIHGVGSEIYNPSLSVLLAGEGLLNFVEGLKILKTILPGARFHLALNKYHETLIEKLAGLIMDLDGIDVYALEPKYPQVYDGVLIPTLLAKGFPDGCSAASIGVVVLDVQTVLQTHEAVTQGKPLIEKIVTLCGAGFRENLHIKVRIGTSLEHITRARVLENRELRFILDSPLTGSVLSDLSLPLDRTFLQIISIPEEREREFLSFARPGYKKDSYSRAFVSSGVKSRKKCDTNLHGEERPCIFCNFCQDACPAGIIPHLIHHHVKRDIVDEVILDLGIRRCIDCNLCSYVCPSKIPLAKSIRKGKEELVMQGFCRK